MSVNDTKQTRFNPVTHEKRASFLGVTLFLDIDKDDGTTDRANASWSMRNEYPRLTVYTSKFTKKEDGTIDYSKIIIAPFDLISAGDLVDEMKKVVANKEKRVLELVHYCYYPKYVDGKKTSEKEVKAIVKFGRDEKGIYYLKVKGKDKPELEFPMLKSEWCVSHGTDDTPESPIMRSKKYAIQYIKILENNFKQSSIGQTTIIERKQNKLQAKPVSKSESDSVMSSFN